ncbi:hypothetical protein [Jiulongibacter sediminis]|uniref:Altered inheritance of mitochondria protein 6 n=1 Tax=Jiulongibacter sediminis TaxID=1605367 RepID=A0A0P7C0P3_9BACT|nr:hypothetical protein [Jiulongibacter sediminis]KPM46837.1 hypothetical protein AFM12_16465 [Jiulongibacter sediminis]
MKTRLLIVVLFCLQNLNLTAQKVHAHNDYEHDFPFWEAYTAGVKSVEADVFEVDGKLLVAHNREDVSAERNLENLYLQPLVKVVQASGFQGLQLLIDFKTEAEPTLSALMKLLENYPQLTANKKVTIAVSGNRPSDYSAFLEYIQFDHQDAENWPETLDNIALLSLPFYKISPWKGQDELPLKDRSKMEEMIAIAHRRGLPIRFWATPDTPLAWKTLKELGVDYINTDKPYECVNFLEK